MAANVQNTPRVTEAVIFVVKTFVSLRGYLASSARPAGKLAALERKVDSHDAAIRTLAGEIQKLLNPSAKKKRPVGFIIEAENGSAD